MKITNSDRIRKRYNRASRIYDLMEKPMEKMGLKKWRIEIMKELHGNVLEVGVGTGKNIEFYPDNVNITAIDFSEKMLEKAKDRAKRLEKMVKLMSMDVQNLEFPDDSFDVVFTSCVFCSVPDPIKGLTEIRRVCKKDGKIIMLEHVRSEKKLLGLIMDVLNPLVVNTYGANINRRTASNITAAGFIDVDTVDLFGDIVKKFMIRNIK